MLLDGVVIAVRVKLEAVKLSKGRSLPIKLECGFGLGFEYKVCVLLGCIRMSKN